MHIRLLDMDDISPHLDNIYDFVNDALEADGVVLIHCARGVNRSAAACLAVIAKRTKVSVNEALSLLKERAPLSTPGFWFQQQIAVWLNDTSFPRSGLADFKKRLQQRKLLDK